MPARKTGYFTRGTFEFLTELKANNNREWFDANRQRYADEVETPMLQFIADIGERMPAISERFVADPRRVGGSMFRIYRDTRFSKDKMPFKSSAGARFPHRARTRDRSVPGFYLHLEPGMCIGGGGIYHPATDALQRTRDRIVTKPAEWEAVLRTKVPIEGDTLARPPRGYAPEHRFIEDLKRKDFYTMTRFTERQVCASDFLDRYTDACARAAPLVQFVAKALALPW